MYAQKFLEVGIVGIDCKPGYTMRRAGDGCDRDDTHGGENDFIHLRQER